jgi:hypothetical protein
MGTFKFDAVARLFGSGMNRREAMRSLVAGAAAVTAGGVLIASEDASAKRRRRKNRKKNNQGGDRGKPEGSPCNKDGECRSSQKLICEIPFGAGNSDKACCRGQGATCSDSQHCCTGEAGGREFECVNGTCQPYVEEL